MMLSIVWDVHPEIFPDSGVPIRWYGLLFAAAFLSGHYIFKKILEKDNAPAEWLDKALYFVMIGTIIGARLGHVFFYDWAYYKNHLIEIPMIWKGGLASHGAAIGIILALYLYSKKVTKKSILWALDRVVITVAAAAILIRTGNFFNSEIIGLPTGTDWGIVFQRIDFVPRHPAQLYEAACYLLIFLLLYFGFFKWNWNKRQGMLFGVFLIGVFTARFFIEFVKENQVDFENTMSLNMGQWLSIPLVLTGLFFLLKSQKQNNLG